MPHDPKADQEKQAAARASLKFVHDGKIVGLGTGSTAAHAVRGLGELVRAGLRIRGIPTSSGTRDLATSLGIPLTNFDEVQQIDVTIDGADEFDPQLNLIKGGGGALLREKIVASASRQLVIVADAGKQVPALGKFPLPVEVIPFAQALLAKEIEALTRQMQNLDPSRFPGNPAMVEQMHREVLSSVDRLELELQRANAETDARTGKPDTIPAGYEEQVADYYRRLSKK